MFCASLADVFDNAVPGGWRADLLHLIRKTPELDWLLLTKRPQNIRKTLPAEWGDGWQTPGSAQRPRIRSAMTSAGRTSTGRGPL